MKKLMFVAAALAAGIAVADVASANTVGYYTATLSKGQNRTFALTLNKIENPTAGVKIADLVKSDNFAGAASFGSADQIWTWDNANNKFANYFYEKKGGGHGTVATYAWKKWNYDEKKIEDIPDTDVVLPGQTFIFQHALGATSDITLTVSGQVQAFDNPGSWTFSKGQNIFIAYSWPVAIKIADIPNLVNLTGEFAGASSFGSADQIWTWDYAHNKWGNYFYEKKGGGHGTVATYAWKKWNYDDKKVEDLTNDDVIHAGEGFIFQHALGATADLTISWKPLTAN